MKKIFLWGMLVFAALAFMACPTDDDPTPTLSKIKITGIPSTQGLDMVTFMLITAAKSEQESVVGLAVAGGKIGQADVPAITDGTAETDLYDQTSATQFLMSAMQGGTPALPATKTISGSGTVAVMYSKASDGEGMDALKNTRVWPNVKFADPRELRWEDGIEIFEFSKVKITNIPGQTAALDMVTFMLVTVSNGSLTENVSGFAVVGGKIITDGDAPAIDVMANTAEMDLYATSAVSAYLGGILSGGGSATALTPTSISGANFTVSVLYAKASDGTSFAMPQHTRTLQVPADLEDGTLVLDWNSGN